MIELLTGEDRTYNMEGQQTKGKLYETTAPQWKMDQHIGVRKHKTQGKHERETQSIGDIPNGMSREEAQHICSQMNRNRELIDEEHITKKCESCERQGRTDVEIAPSGDGKKWCKTCRLHLMKKLGKLGAVRNAECSNRTSKEREV